MDTSAVPSETSRPDTITVIRRGEYDFPSGSRTKDVITDIREHHPPAKSPDDCPYLVFASRIEDDGDFQAIVTLTTTRRNHRTVSWEAMEPFNFAIQLLGTDFAASPDRKTEATQERWAPTIALMAKIAAGFGALKPIEMVYEELEDYGARSFRYSSKTLSEPEADKYRALNAQIRKFCNESSSTLADATNSFNLSERMKEGALLASSFLEDRVRGTVFTGGSVGKDCIAEVTLFSL